jgi:CheY-like chemotaxis protein
MEPALPVKKLVRCLIVDDDRIIHLVMGQLLKSEGCEVVCASNGRDGVRKAVEFLPHIIFMDLLMPDMSGIEATKELRSLPALEQHRPVILAFTSSKDMLIHDQCLEVGMDDFIEKPFNPAVISLAFERWRPKD